MESNYWKLMKQLGINTNDLSDEDKKQLEQDYKEVEEEVEKQDKENPNGEDLEVED